MCHFHPFTCKSKIKNLFCDPWHRKSRNLSGCFWEKKTKQSQGFRTAYPNLYRAGYSSSGFESVLWMKVETEHDFSCSLHRKPQERHSTVFSLRDGKMTQHTKWRYHHFQGDISCGRCGRDRQHNSAYHRHLQNSSVDIEFL